MMKFLLLSSVLGFGAATWVEVTATPPAGWVDVGPPSESTRMNLSIALHLPEFKRQQLEQAFWGVSTPGSDTYQQFLTKEDIESLVSWNDDCKAGETRIMSPTCVSQRFHEEVALLLQTTADTQDFASLRVHANRIDFEDVPMQMVEAFFRTKLTQFRDQAGHMLVRCQGTYSLPKSLMASVAFVEGLGDFPQLSQRSHPVVNSEQENAKRGDFPDANVVPQTLASMYNFNLSDMVNPRVIHMPGECDAFVPDGGSFLPTDLKKFLKAVQLPDQVVAHVNGSGTHGKPGIEGSLDIQYITASGLGGTSWYYTTKGWVYSLTTEINSWTEVPHTVSMSFGGAESGQCSTASTICKKNKWNAKGYINAVNVEFMKLGLRGVSVFVSSGDGGAGAGETLSPAFPASSPYITSVGGTQFETVSKWLDSSVAPTVCTSKNKCAQEGHEMATSDFLSGGGFSNYVARPAFQAPEVEAYLKSGVKLPAQKCFNSTGRGYPDVAALGINFMVQQQGQWQPVGGTSASAPTWAGIAARLVDKSLSLTGKPLGPLNPLLYKLAREAPAGEPLFQDITKGNNGEASRNDCSGYVATKGWDAVTGLGTPNVGRILAALEKTLKLHKAATVVV